MKPRVSKSQQAWRLLMQSPCPLRAGLLAGVLAWGLALPDPASASPTATATATATTTVSATASPSAPAPGMGKSTPAVGMPTWPAAATPEQALAKAVGQWLGAQQGRDPTAIRLAPLDPRLQIKACQSGLHLDLPFASQETVRVRCAAPTWQLFVRVLPPPPGTQPATQAGTQATQQGAPQPGPGLATAQDQPAPLRKVVVATGLLQRGMRLNANQVSLVERPANSLPLNALERIEDVVNAELVRDVPGGSPLRSQDIRPALMVKRGQLVMLSTGAVAGLRVVARLEAMQDGRMGEQIKLKNTESGRQVSAVVTGLNTADAL